MSDAEAATRQVGMEYNPLAPPHVESPYPFYARAQRDGPITYSPLLDVWLVSRHADITAIMDDPARFSSAESLRSRVRLAPEALAVLMSGYPERSILVNDDPPAHTRIRALCHQAFTPQRVQRLEPRIRARASELIESFNADGEADMIGGFARPLLASVLCDLIGVPVADTAKVTNWADDWRLLFSAQLSVERQIACALSVLALQRFLASLVAKRRAQGQDDLLTDLVNARVGSDFPLDTVELLSLLPGMFFIGHEATASLIGSALLLLASADEWQTAQGSPILLDQVIEETLRLESPMQSVVRITTEPVTFNGAVLPRGARLHLLLGAANHDHHVFTSPHTFAPGREDASDHLAFGHGIHLCIGAPLGRLVARVALEVLAERLPDLRLQPSYAPEWVPSSHFRSLRRLPLEWHRAEAVGG